MDYKAIIKYAWPVLAILFINIFQFFPEFQGKTLSRGDAIQADAKNQARQYYQEKDQETYVWNPGQFSGMPMLYGPPVKKNLLHYVGKVLTFGLDRPIGIFVILMLSIYIMGLIIGFSPGLSFTTALAIGLPITNMILWKAGHTSKIMALSYTGFIIAGVYLIFEQRKYWLGAALFALGLGLNLHARHPQMTYYIFMVFMVYGFAKLAQIIKNKDDFKPLIKGAMIVLVTAILAVGSSASKIWSMKVHADASMRGKPVLETTNATNASSSAVDGLNWDYAMAWSNNIPDLISTVIPGFSGGGSSEKVSTSSQSYKKFKIKAAPLYWGGLPFTEAPMYLGAISFFLFLFGGLYYKGHIKWWLVIGVLLTLVLSMGKNVEWFNRILFDYFPLYNKFRTPQSVLSVTAYFMPILGAFGIHRLMKEGYSDEFKRAFFISTGATALFCLLSWLVFPSMLSFDGASDAKYVSQGLDIDIFKSDRVSLLKADSLRTLLLILCAAGLLWFYAKKKLPEWGLILGLSILVVIDLMGVNMRYISFSDYESKRKVSAVFNQRPVDKQILSRESDRSAYRVLDVSINTFNSALSSYHHNTIGGYDPAKLQRYQDIIDYHISKNNMNVLNMLNTKYVIQGDPNNPQMSQNPDALGVAWFVNDVKIVDTPNQEIDALSTVDPGTTAVVLNNEFDGYVSNFTPSNSSGSSISISSYAPDKIVYKANSNGDGFVVFSEVWFDRDSWKVTLDGQEVPFVRANYILRGMKVPNGQHEIVFEFKPTSYYTGEMISLVCSFLLIILMVYAGFLWWRSKEGV